jgi:hypothetical protein
VFWSKQSRLKKKLRVAAEQGNVVDIAQALDLGADIDVADGFGLTPLARAAFNGHRPAVKLLLDRGASFTTQDNDGDTALACAVQNGHAKIVAELVARGASKDTTNNRCLSALDLASSDELRTALGCPPPPVAAPPPAPKEEHPDEITVTRSFGGTRILQEIYNFAAKERISVVRNGAEGPVEAMTREAFTVIGDKDGLRRAYARYAERGGAVPESEIFPDELGKTKPAVLGTPEPSSRKN